MTDNYEERYWDNSSKIKYSLVDNLKHVISRRPYSIKSENKERKKKKKSKVELLINSPMIEKRGKKLARLIEKGKYSFAREIYEETCDADIAIESYSYLYWDYQISPEVARRMFLYAILNFNKSKAREASKTSGKSGLEQGVA